MIYFLEKIKGSFISFQLVPDTPGSDFPPSNNPKFDKIKKLKSLLQENFSFFILSNFGLLGGGKSEPGVSGTNWNEIKLPLKLSDTQAQQDI